MSNSLQPHGLQHARLPCPSLSPRVCSNSCPLNQWCCQSISSSVIPFSFCLQSFPASESFSMSWLFASGGESIGASASVLRMNIQGWFFFFFRIYWFVLLTVQGALKSFLQHHSLKASILRPSAAFMVQLSHLYMTMGKTIDLTIRTFVDKVMSLLFNMLFVIAFLPRGKGLNFMAAVAVCSDFGAQENKICYHFPFFPIYLPWIDGTECHDLSFLVFSFQVSFFTLLFHLHPEALQFCFTFCH